MDRNDFEISNEEMQAAMARAHQERSREMFRLLDKFARALRHIWAPRHSTNVGPAAC